MNDYQSPIFDNGPFSERTCQSLTCNIVDLLYSNSYSTRKGDLIKEKGIIK